MHRRYLLKAALLGTSAFLCRPSWVLGNESDMTAAHLADQKLAELERRNGGRLGVAILDTGSGYRASHRGDERFLMCSTFKLLAVAAVLARVDRGAEQLDRRIVFGRAALLNYAPVTSRHVGPPGMRVDELCGAAITLSDNTAANLLLASMGGPQAVTLFARRLGDEVTRLDRIEPDLNVASPGDLRDTTTPNAMLATLQRVLLGDALSIASRERLTAWLRGCMTGAGKLRAGLPAAWSIGDKTGSGAQNETNDIGILYPPQRPPVLAVSYYAGSTANADARNAVLASVGHIASALGR